MASNINPNNIDGAYPVAGQDNNSQGFRDNFTNTKTNFQFAEQEINDLQSKAVLKAALTGQSLDNNMNDNLLYAAKIQDFSATKVTLTPVAGVATLVYSAGHYQALTTTGSVTLAFSAFPTSGNYGYIRFQIQITNLAHTMTLPVAVSLGLSGIQGISPGIPGVTNTITFAATGTYEFAFGTYDGGSTITLFDLNRALTNFTAADLTLDDLSASGFVSAVGNVTGGNLRTAGSVSATGNIVGGNVTTVGLISATGNITGGNIAATNHTGTTVSVTGNVTGLLRPAAGSTTTQSQPLIFATGSVVNFPTQTLNGGTLEYDGVSVYVAPTNNQRGVVATQHYYVNTGDVGATNSAAAQNIFTSTGAGNITLPATTTYQIDALYIVAPSSSTNMNAVTMSTLFAVTSALSNIRYIAESSVDLATNNAAITRRLVTAPTSTVVTAAAPGGAESIFIVRLQGILRTNAATTLSPQMAFSGTPGASGLRVLTSSYFKLVPLGAATTNSIGYWVT